MSIATIERSLIVEAPVSRVWDVISDLNDYHLHTDTLAETRVISGQGEGATRHCVDRTGHEWDETCTIWEPGRKFTIEVDVSTYPTKYKVMFRSFRGTWSVAPHERGSRVTVRFEAELRRLAGLSGVVSKIVEQGVSDLDAILDSYRRTAEGAVSGY